MNTFTKLFTLTFVCFTLSACGGGGGGEGGTPSSATSSSNTTSTSASNTNTTVSTDTTSDQQDTSVTPAEPAPSYEPDPSLLDSQAETSNDLHVKADFNFSTSKTVTLDLSGQDVLGASLANKMVKVYALHEVVDSYEDQAIADKALLATTRFNSAGQITMTLDVPVNYKTLLISVDGMLQDNHLLSELSMQTTTVAHQFN
ncbi:hypothetical protein CWB99_08890 [Pseudoalteromonas rubra]|uniref:Lipoprotein n=1 Tax=Pseudoalteromonas rubra TaxID=43658 RepID=A0A5S3WPQ9_9GAMM|nr:hypothetical protein [Pseudoalteromonas rubra]TMP29304.1 hypothetical protein CWB99_08890 [Pseudoalteromonas rubra]TMP34091.1 hypothetical protein CWC00_09350 [Pseudoalteromonas rubra]